MEAAEIFRLVLVAVTLPFFVMLARRLRPEPGRNMLFAGVAVIYVSFVASVIEDVVAGDLFNMVQHASYGVAGVLGLIGVLSLRRALKGGGRS
jgi:hypothetical protein